MLEAAAAQRFRELQPELCLLVVRGVAFGVAAAFLLTVTFVPIVTSYLPLPPERARKRNFRSERFLEGLHTFTFRHSGAILGVAGVLVFVSVAEHVAVVIADKGIHDRVDPAVWADIVRDLTAHLADGRLADGLTAAIAACGRVLAEHFPPAPNDENELPDRLVEI